MNSFDVLILFFWLKFHACSVLFEQKGKVTLSICVECMCRSAQRRGHSSREQATSCPAASEIPAPKPLGLDSDQTTNTHTLTFAFTQSKHNNVHTPEHTRKAAVNMQRAEACESKHNTSHTSPHTVAASLKTPHTQKVPSAGSIVGFFLLWRPWGSCSGKGNAVLCNLYTQQRGRESLFVGRARGQALSSALIRIPSVNILSAPETEGLSPCETLGRRVSLLANE